MAVPSSVAAMMMIEVLPSRYETRLASPVVKRASAGVVGGQVLFDGADQGVLAARVVVEIRLGGEDVAVPEGAEPALG
jgi:hypothetical protein